MKRMLKTQFYLMFRQKFLFVICCVTFVMSVLNVLMSFFMSGLTGASATGFSLFQSFVTDISTPVILCIILAGYFFNKDISNRTVSIALCAGVNRFTYWTAKCIVYIVGSLIISLVAPAVGAIGGTLLGGGLSAGGWGQAFDPLFTLRIALLYMAAIVGIVGVFAVFASLLTETSGVIAISIAFCAVFQIGSVIALALLSKYEWSQYLVLLPSLSVMAIATPDMELTDALVLGGVDLLFALLLFGLSYVIFRKRELK
jgi:ABC-2 type transport system permease protein